MPGVVGLGVGALAKYGPTYSAKYCSKNWPEHVSKRIHSTYAYLGGFYAVAAGVTGMILKCEDLENLITENASAVLVIALATYVGTKLFAR